MYYIDWNLENEIDGWKELNLGRLLTEVDEEGYVVKEIGIDISDNVVHMFPSDKFRYGDFGMWDNVKIEQSFYEIISPKRNSISIGRRGSVAGKKEI